MNPELRLEVPDTPDRIRRPSNQNNKPRNLRLNLSRRTAQPIIDLSSPTPPNDNQRKRKIPSSSAVPIPESSNKRGKNVAQQSEEEIHGGDNTVRDNKGKGKADAHFNDKSFKNSPPRRMGQRFLVRSGGVTAPNNVSNEEGVSGTTAVPAPAPAPVRRRFLVRNGVIAPVNIEKRNGASNNNGADRKVTVMESSSSSSSSSSFSSSSLGIMQSTSGGAAGSSSSAVGGVRDDAVLSEIVADDPCLERAIRSRRENSATGPSSIRLNNPNLAASTASISAPIRPISNASTSTIRTRQLGSLNPQRRRIRTQSSSSSSSSLYEIGSSSAADINQAEATRAARIRRFELQPVIDVDEIASPDESGASVRRGQQLARDEMIARRLQEELYNEIPGEWNVDEMDARMAMSLQQEENANATRSSPIRRRTTRVGRSAQFVAASSLVRNNFRLQVLQDFDPDDYETLLALDENNHQHTGASTSQINTLPESIVTSSNLDETCAVCIETPSIGEKIRHLPCFHKFHKDCIDQWLQRKKECPICKCSIF